MRLLRVHLKGLVGTFERLLYCNTSKCEHSMSFQWGRADQYCNT